jgi:hypothetical protein
MKYGYLAIPVVALILGILVLSTPSINPVSENEGLKYDGVVCVYKNNQLVECKHNLITNLGLNLIKTTAGQGTAMAVTKIAVANATGTAQSATDTSLTGEWASCGLTATTGTYVNQAGNGQWNITYQWTQTGCSDVLVNGTGLYNATGASQLFAETSFSAVTLQANDRINVTWGLVVS